MTGRSSSASRVERRSNRRSGLCRSTEQACAVINGAGSFYEMDRLIDPRAIAVMR